MFAALKLINTKNIYQYLSYRSYIYLYVNSAGQTGEPNRPTFFEGALEYPWVKIGFKKFKNFWFLD